MDELTQEIILLRQHYKNCFGTPSGRIVLAHMLQEMRFFNDDIEAEDHTGRVLRNYAMTLIERLGTADNPDRTIDAIVEIILKLPKQEKE